MNISPISNRNTTYLVDSIVREQQIMKISRQQEDITFTNSILYGEHLARERHYSSLLEISPIDEVVKLAQKWAEDPSGQVDSQIMDFTADYARLMQVYFEGKDLEEGFKNIDKLSNQIEDIIKEVGKQISETGEVDIQNIQSQLTINGKDISVDEYSKMMNILQKVNISSAEMTFTPSGQNGLTDTGNFVDDVHEVSAMMGLASVAVNRLADTELSADTGELLKDIFSKKIDEKITAHDDAYNEWQEFKSTEQSNYGNRSDMSVYYDGIVADKDELDATFYGSTKEELYNRFASIDTSSEESFQKGFEESMKELESVQRRMDSAYGGRIVFDFDNRNSWLKSIASSVLGTFE